MSIARFFNLLFLIALLATPSIFAQKKRPPVKAKKSVIFAVLNDGLTLEPIAYIDKGKLAPAVAGDSDSADITAFHRSYYKIKAVYPLIFGGTNAGTVTIKSADPKAECSQHMAQISFSSTKAKLKGNVMALATNAVLKKAGSGVRRLPIPAERAEIEKLVKAEFVKNNISEEVAKNLKYHNLTAIDVDGDGKIELVGTFWVDTAPKTRGLLFFIADREEEGYSFGHSEFSSVDEANVMSENIADVDSGVYHERLLDLFDYDADGVSEIFTYIQSFEGAGFNAYRREGGKWVKSFYVSNYHCGY